MPCVSSKYTETELRDLILSKEIKKIGEITDPKEWAATMVKITKMVDTKEVDAETLGPKYMRSMGLKKGDKIPRYFLDSVQLAKKRGSDLQTIKMIKNLGLEEAKSISEKVDTVVKALGGTRIHFANQQLIGALLETGQYKNLAKPSEVDPDFKIMEDSVIAKQANIPPAQLKKLKQGMDYLLKKIDSIQANIDPNNPAVVLTEQFVLNPNKDTGGTIDVLVRFSDNTTGTLDFKTISPDEASKKIDWQTNEIIDPDWIPNIKKIAIREQLSDYNNTLETFYGSKGTLISRGIPIYTRYVGRRKEARGEGAYLTENIKYIAMQGVEGLKDTQNMLLSHIPVQEFILLKDKHKQKKINDALKHLGIVINNLEIEITQLGWDTEAYTKMKASLENYKKARDKLILDQDFNEMFNSFEQMLEEITVDGKLTELNNIDDPTINGKTNPNYLSNGELTSKIREVEALKNVIAASPFYVQDLELYQDPKIYRDYLADVDKLTGEANRILELLKAKSVDRVLTEGEQAAMEDVGPVGWWSKFFRSLGDQVAVPFRKVTRLLANANNLKRLAHQEFMTELGKVTKDAEKGGRKIGKSLSGVFDMMIDNRTENLWGEHNKEFWEDFKKAQKNKDSKWLDKHLNKKPDAQIRYERNLAVYEASNAFHAKRDPEGWSNRLENWKKFNDPDAVRYSSKWWMYYDIAETMDEKYYSEGFKEIRKIPEILAYYRFWEKNMTMFNDMLGFRGEERLPKNFLPYIRQDIVGLISQGTFEMPHLTESASSLFQVRQDDTGLGDMTVEGLADPVTGRPKHTIPRYFTNPIKDSKGQIIRGMKVRDLSKSLAIFAEMAYNYHYMKTEVEPHIEALRDYMMEMGMQQMTEGKRKKKLLSGAWAKIKGEGIEPIDMLDRYINYHMYGIKIQDATKSQAKAVQVLKSIQSNTELAFAPLLWTGNFVQVKTNSYLEGANGYYYSAAQMAETEAQAMGAMGTDPMKIYSGLSRLFEFSPGVRGINIKNKSINFGERFVDWDTAHFGMRKTEQAVNNNIGVSVLKNWAVVDGKVVRLANAPEGTKSIYASTRIENDTLIIDGVTDSKGKVLNIDTFSQIRNLAVSVSSKVKGTMNPEDLSLVYMNLLSNAAMGFKTWMPNMLDARFSLLRYSPMSNSMVEGKYVSMFTDMSREDRGFLDWVGNVVLPKMGQLTMNIATFGAYNYLAPGKFKYKVNETRARRMFDQYKEQFKHDSEIQAMEFKDFLDFKQRQIRSASAELSAILAVVTIVAMLKGDWDDDGEADWKKNAFSRTLFRMMNRSRRELAFFISPNDWQNLFRMPIPVMSLVPDTMNALYYALDGMGDIVTGEEPVTDRGRSKFYYLWRRVPGNKLILMFEPDEMSKLREI